MSRAFLWRPKKSCLPENSDRQQIKIKFDLNYPDIS
jgi:hypothetical protein